MGRYMAQFQGHRPPRSWRRLIRVPSAALQRAGAVLRAYLYRARPLTHAERRELVARANRYHWSW